VSAAEPLPAVVWQRFRDRFGVEILDGIGSTEMTHIFISNRPGRIVPGTSGWPVEGYEARLSRLDGGGAPPGEPGVLWVRGPSAAIGYWKDAATSAATFADGWARTGDLYQCSPTDGTYTYLGRVDDMLKVGGEWVSPAEVEATLLAHEGVLEAAVVGERDAAGVVRPIAFVVPVGAASLDPDELIEFTRTRLAGYKRPRHVEVVSELPKTATGKIQRFKLSRAVAP
jgi:benzoate-CoA ligase